MNSIQIGFIIFLIITFILGIVSILEQSEPTEYNKEAFSNLENMSSGECPDMLVQKGNVLALYNSQKPREEGTNPLLFQTLDDYIIHLENQRTNGIDCPVLYLRQENDAQGNDIYRVRPSPFELDGGVPASNGTKPVEVQDANRLNQPFNANNYPGIDPTGQYVGVYTNIDAIHDSTKKQATSDNPMDTNWGGTKYTQTVVQTGKYVGREVARPTLTTPKVSFDPTLPTNLTNPIDVI